jgi:hypothetical protein
MQIDAAIEFVLLIVKSHGGFIALAAFGFLLRP